MTFRLASLFFHLFIYHEKISAACFSKLVLRRKYYNLGGFVTESVTKLCGEKKKTASLRLFLTSLGLVILKDQQCEMVWDGNPERTTRITYVPLF